MRHALQRTLTGLTAALLGLALTATFPTTADAVPDHRDRRILNAVKVALDQRGSPYVYGADGPSTFDCSGLLQYSFGRAGISLPRVSGDQAAFARQIPRGNIRRGDLMAFYGSGGVYHIAIYLGQHNGQPWMIHSANPTSDTKREVAWTDSWFATTLRRR